MKDIDSDFLWGVAVIAAVSLWYFWDSAYMVAWRNDTQVEKVYIERKPHDCEWSTSPIGDKHCSYDADIKKDSNGHVFLSWRRKEQ